MKIEETVSKIEKAATKLQIETLQDEIESLNLKICDLQSDNEQLRSDFYQCKAELNTTKVFNTQVLAERETRISSLTRDLGNLTRELDALQKQQVSSEHLVRKILELKAALDKSDNDLRFTKALLEQTSQNVLKVTKERNIVEYNHTTALSNLESIKKSQRLVLEGKDSELLSLQTETKHLKALIAMYDADMLRIANDYFIGYRNCARNCLKKVDDYKKQNNIA